MYLKRQSAPKSWPIMRKGTTYVVRPMSGSNNESIPLLIALREMLKITRNRNEAKKALRLGEIKVNGKIVFDERRALRLFDVITISVLEKSYKVSLNDRAKFELIEVNGKDTEIKIVKLINKKTLKKKKTQLNFSDGSNVISNMKCNVNDSVVIDFKGNKPEKCLELKEKAKVLVIGGKHTGAFGTIDSLDKEHKMAEVEEDSRKGKEKIHVLIKHIIVVE